MQVDKVLALGASFKHAATSGGVSAKITREKHQVIRRRALIGCLLVSRDDGVHCSTSFSLHSATLSFLPSPHANVTHSLTHSLALSLNCFFLSLCTHDRAVQTTQQRRKHQGKHKLKLLVEDHEILNTLR